MLTLTITITGRTESDLTSALGDIHEKLDSCYRSGRDRNEFGSFEFQVTGESEESPVGDADADDAE